MAGCNEHGIFEGAPLKNVEQLIDNIKIYCTEQEEFHKLWPKQAKALSTEGKIAYCIPHRGIPASTSIAIC